MRDVKFHWALPVEAVKTSEGKPDASGQVDVQRLKRFVEIADKSSISTLLTPFGFHMPDPIPLLGMLAGCSSRVGFLLAYRTGSISPVLFVQQVNTLSQLLPDRLAINFVAGISPEEQQKYGDFQNHDSRYARAAEFIDVCRRLWTKAGPFDYEGEFYKLNHSELQTGFSGTASRPRIYISGNSQQAQKQAETLSDCWLRYGDTAQNIAAQMPESVRASRIGAGLRVSIIARSTRDEAVRAADDVIRDADPNWKQFIKGFVERSDSNAVRNTYGLSQAASEKWLNEDLWTGAVPYRGGPALAIVGDYSQVAAALHKFRTAGVSEFILSGWPSDEELIRFDQEVLPRFLEGGPHVRTA